MAVPNEGTQAFPSDTSGRYALGLWDGSNFYALRDASSGDSAHGALFVPEAWDTGGSTGKRILTAKSLGDALDGSQFPGAGNALWNGASWDRQYNANEGTAITLLARTASSSSAHITNYNCRGIMLQLHVTAGGPSGGLHPRVACVDPVSGVLGVYLNSNPAVVNGTGTWTYIIYPGASGSYANGASPSLNVSPWQVTSLPISRMFEIDVLADDATSYTYSVGYSLIP